MLKRAFIVKEKFDLIKEWKMSAFLKINKL